MIYNIQFELYVTFVINFKKVYEYINIHICKLKMYFEKNSIIILPSVDTKQSQNLKMNAN